MTNPYEIWFGVLAALMLSAYGIFCLIWPEKARAHFLANYDLESPTKWHDPATWLKYKPSLLIFRIIGILCFTPGVFLIFEVGHNF